jgi:hypothetical protein
MPGPFSMNKSGSAEFEFTFPIARLVGNCVPDSQCPAILLLQSPTRLGVPGLPVCAFCARGWVSPVCARFAGCPRFGFVPGSWFDVTDATSDVRTTMGQTLILNRGGRVVRSPADVLARRPQGR